MIKPAEIPGKTLSGTGVEKDQLLSFRLRLFEAYFQKTFRRRNLVYNKKEGRISCTNFPLKWTDFEYSGMIKISFRSTIAVDYKNFRKESINEFNTLFKNHRTFWSYPYNTIRIYGNETAHGIDSTDVHRQIAYLSFLIEEVTRFFEAREDVLLKTELYRYKSYSI